MLSGDKKKVGALVGAIILVAGIILAVIKMNAAPNRIVDEASSNTSVNLPLAEEDVSEDSVTEAVGEAPGENSLESGNTPRTIGSTRLPEPPAQESSSLPTGGELEIHARESSAEASTAQTLQPEVSSETQAAESSAEASTSPETDTSEQAGQTSEVAQASETSETSRTAQTSQSEETPASEVAQTSEAETSSTQVAEGDVSEEAPVVALGDKVPGETTISRALAGLSVYAQQTLGNTAVSFYQHPALSVGLDLRRDMELAKQLYVQQTESGFVIFPRPMLSVLGLSPQSVEGYLAEDKAIPGSVVVSRVSAEERAQLEADSANETLFVEAEDNASYAIHQETEGQEKYQGVYGMLTPELTAALVQENLTTAGMIGDPAEPKADVTLAEQQDTWTSLVQRMRDNPALVEFEYNLPLLSPAAAYSVDGKDIRTNIPSGTPGYTFGRTDLNGDGVPEYLIHAETSGSSAGKAAGYWAILEPTASGLAVSNVLPDGNGDLFVGSNGNLILPSVDRTEESTVLSIADKALGQAGAAGPAANVVFHRIDEGMTGADLATSYPEDYVVLANDTIYRFSMVDFNEYMDYVQNRLTGAKQFAFVGPMEDPATGDTNPDGMQAIDVSDPILMLQEKYPDLPLSSELLQKATPTSTFAELTTPLTPGDFDRVEAQ